MNLIDAVINRDIESVKQLLNDGADPNEFEDEAEITPLHFAAQLNTIEIGELLIKAGADIYARTVPEAETPLEIAQLHGHKKFIRMLLKYIKKNRIADYIN